MSSLHFYSNSTTNASLSDKLEKYPKGANKLYKFLSKNKTKSVLNETEEEGLLGLVRSLIAAQELDEAIKPANEEESKYCTMLKNIQAWALKVSHISKVWNCNYSIRFLLEIFWCSPHLVKSKLTHVHWLGKTVYIHGGVSLPSLSMYSILMCITTVAW